MSGTASFIVMLPVCGAETILDPRRRGEGGSVLVLESHHLKPERQAFVGQYRERDRRNAEIGRMHRARRIAGRTEAARSRTGRGEADASVGGGRQLGVLGADLVALSQQRAVIVEAHGFGLREPIERMLAHLSGVAIAKCV